MQQGVTAEVQPDGKWFLAGSNSCLSRSVLHTTQKEQIVTRTSARNLPLWVKQGASLLSINCLIFCPCIIPLPAHLCCSDPKGKKRPLLFPGQPGRVLVSARPAVRCAPADDCHVEKRPIDGPAAGLVRPEWRGAEIRVDPIEARATSSATSGPDHHVGNQLQ